MDDPALDPRFKTRPYRHQLEAFERYADSRYFALFFEQRCGKTKPTLDIAANHYRQGRVRSLLVIAPNGVHLQWAYDAIPEHLPDDVNGLVEVWSAARIKQKGVQAKLRALLLHPGLRILCVNIDAIDTKEFKNYVNEIFARGRVMTVVDESSDISSERANRTKAALKIGRVSKVRAILDGTPAAAGPMGLYGQCEFLDPACLGYTSYFAYKARYAITERKDFGERTRECPDCGGHGYRAEVICARCHATGLIGKTQVQVIVGFQHTEELAQKLKPFSTRLLRSDCHDLPPKIYNKIYFELDAETRRVYDSLRDEFVAELKSGTRITAPMVLTRYIRLQQVASGFYPTSPEVLACPDCRAVNSETCLTCDGTGAILSDVEKRAEPISDVNARLKAFGLATLKLTGPGIIWCQFDHDIEAVMELGRERGLRVTRYDGKVGNDAKRAAVTGFQAGEIDWFVSKQRSGGRGLDLALASWMIYYSHGWSLRMRLQSEDRAQSLKKTDSVSYNDLIADETIDGKIVDALRKRKKLSDLITGDKPEAWL